MSGLSLAEEMDALTVPPARAACPVARLVAELGPEVGEKLRRLVDETPPGASRPVGTQKISLLMGRHGFAIGKETIANHRRGQCRCSA